MENTGRLFQRCLGFVKLSEFKELDQNNKSSMESFVSVLTIAEGALASSPYCTGGKCYEVVSNSRTRNSAASDCYSDRKIYYINMNSFWVDFCMLLSEGTPAAPPNGSWVY